MGKPITDFETAMEAATRVAGDKIEPSDRAQEVVRPWPAMSLADKLVSIMARIGDPQPKGHNRHFDYPFYKESDLAALFRPLFIEFRVIIIPRVLTTEGYEHPTKGGRSYLTTLLVEFTLINADDPSDRLTGSAAGQGDDPGDKGAPKAMTTAFKFFLLKLFAIGGEGDPEADERTDERSVERRPRGQSEDRVEIRDSNIEGIQRGGRANMATEAQIRRVRELARDLKYSAADTAKFIDGELGDQLDLPEDPREQGAELVKYLESLNSIDIGSLITALVATRDGEQPTDDSGYGS